MTFHTRSHSLMLIDHLIVDRAYGGRYKKKLKDRTDIVERLRKEEKARRITLLFSAMNIEYNNAKVLKEAIEGKL